MDLHIRLQPRQSDLWELWDRSDVTRIGFGGARGGSKSGGGRRCMLLRRLKYPNTTGLILRRTYPELYKSHLVKLFEEFPHTRSWYNEQRKEMHLPNGSRLFFGSAEHERDMSNFYSAEFADIMVDEAQEFSQGELEQLSASCRCTSNPAITPKMVYTFMPGMSEAALAPKGLPYLKRVFVDQALRGEETVQRWAFLQAFSWDNIEWARKELERDGVTEDDFYSWSDADRRIYFVARTEYGRSLAALTNPYLRDAWLYGKWDVFQGQYFPNFNYDQHTVPAEEIVIKPWHKRWIGGDWGYDHPAYMAWFRQDEHGAVVTYRELWGRELGESALGRRIGEFSAGEKISAFFLSWDAFGKLSKTTPKAITELIAEALPKNVSRPVPADSSPGARISGWRLMHQLLDSGMWKISRACLKLIECLPTLVRNPDHPEDVLKVDYSENYIGDDPADGARYGLQNMLSVSQMPAKERLRQAVEAKLVASGKQDDPNARFMTTIEEQERQRKARRSVRPSRYRPPIH